MIEGCPDCTCSPTCPTCEEISPPCSNYCDNCKKKTMTDKMFVVSETSFEYNDEVHSVGESEGGSPVAVFPTKEEADKDAQTRIINDFLKGWAGGELCCFGYGNDEIFSRVPKFLDVIPKIFFDDEEWNCNLSEKIKVKELSDEELEELADSLEFRPYFVTEVPVGQAV